MSSFIEEVKAKAAADRKTIVLPESNDKRTYEAIEMIKKENFADLVLVATPEDVEKYGAGYDLSGVTVVDPVNGRITVALYFRQVRASNRRDHPGFCIVSFSGITSQSSSAKDS